MMISSDIAMKKILYILNSSRRKSKSKGIQSFNYTAYKAALELGYEFHVNTMSPEAVAENTDPTVHLHVVEVYRNPFSKDVLVGYRQLMDLLRTEKFDAIHCNTPIGGVLGRICGKKAGVPKIIYQVHGFHFYKGAPLINWILYYPIEKWLARYTDAIITINHEDYDLVKSKFHLRNNGNVYYVPGVGVDLSKYNFDEVIDKAAIRESLGLSDSDIMLISAGDLIERKNYRTAIKAIAEVGNPNIKYCICGRGPQHEELKKYAKGLGVESQILFLGFRTDIKELFRAADIFLFTTKQEGLPRSMMEAMACGLPCIASKIRGNVDLLEDGKGGYLCDLNNPSEFTEAICKLTDDQLLRESFSNANLERIKDFENSVITEQLRGIYEFEM